MYAHLWTMSLLYRAKLPLYMCCSLFFLFSHGYFSLRCVRISISLSLSPRPYVRKCINCVLATVRCPSDCWTAAVMAGPSSTSSWWKRSRKKRRRRRQRGNAADNAKGFLSRSPQGGGNNKLASASSWLKASFDASAAAVAVLVLLLTMAASSHAKQLQSTQTGNSK